MAPRTSYKIPGPPSRALCVKILRVADLRDQRPQRPVIGLRRRRCSSLVLDHTQPTAPAITLAQHQTSKDRLPGLHFEVMNASNSSMHPCFDENQRCCCDDPGFVSRCQLRDIFVVVALLWDRISVMFIYRHGAIDANAPPCGHRTAGRTDVEQQRRSFCVCANRLRSSCQQGNVGLIH